MGESRGGHTPSQASRPKVPPYWQSALGAAPYRFGHLHLAYPLPGLLPECQGVMNTVSKEGCWEGYLKYIGQNCLSYFHSIHQTNSGQVTIVV